MALNVMGSSPITHPTSFYWICCLVQSNCLCDGVWPSGKARDFDSLIRRFNSCHPSMHDPLAQSVEHLTFNQGVWSSILQWVTPLPSEQLVSCGRGGMADAPDLGSGAYGVRVQVSSSARIPEARYAVVAQLVECHLAKVDVAGPNPVYRSIRGCSSMVEPQPSKLVTWVRFPSPALWLQA